MSGLLEYFVKQDRLQAQFRTQTNLTKKVLLIRKKKETAIATHEKYRPLRVSIGMILTEAEIQNDLNVTVSYL